jgi:hypothetical protein
MPRKLIAVLLIAMSCLALSATAAAKTPTRVPFNKLLLVSEGSAMADVVSFDEVPLGWGSSARQAMTAAERTSTMQQLHRRIHPLHVFPYVWRGQHPYWYIEFVYHGKIVADANVSPAGKVTGVWTGKQAWAPYTHGNIEWAQTSWLVLVPGALLFLLPFVDPRRLRRMAHLDALSVLALLASFLLMAGAHLESSVWLVYPPLIYLLLRMLRVGFRGEAPSGRFAPLLSMRTLLIGLPVLLAVRIVLSLVGNQEIDVGYESVIGAFRALHHLPLYYNDPNHGDTYGPFAYLAYVPFELIFPWKNGLSNLHAADAAAIFFDLGTIAGLVLLGRRLRAGREGTRLGLVLAWAWAACPFTTLNLVVHTNDTLIAMLGVWALVALASPLVSGTLLGLATAAKFSPAGLLPLLAAPRQRGRKGALVYTGAFCAVTATAIGAWLPSGGIGYFWDRTIGFQLTRIDVSSPWALHPSLHPIQMALEVAAVGLVILVAFVPRERSLARVCALAGAITIAIQLPAQHWFYYYIAWFLPFVLVAVLAQRVEVTAPATEPVEPSEPVGEPVGRAPVLAGA